MKNLYFIAAALFCTTISAQSVINFEASEGYQLGDIRNQNSWQVTDDGEGNFISNQIITNEKFSSGAFSFKNAYEPEYGDQFFPIMGAQKTLDQPLNYQNSTISFDVLVTEDDASNFEMAGYGISTDEKFYPVFNLAFDYAGTLKVVTNIDYDMEDTGFAWQPNVWYAIKVEVSATDIKYFVNNAFIYSTPNFTQINVVGLNFLHDNYGGDAYIDNIIVNNNLTVNNVVKGSIALFPNPVKNNLNFSLPNGEKIAKISVTNIAGQTVLNKEFSQNTINLENLKPGVYLVTISNNKGVSYTSKFIKE